MITITTSTAIINEIKATETVDAAWSKAVEYHYGEMPELAGLDRYEEKENEIIFHDRGWNGGREGGNTFRLVGK